VAIAEATGNDPLWANAASTKGWFLAESGRPAAGIELAASAWQAADRANHVTAAFFTTWMLSFMWWNVRDFTAAVTTLRRELDTERSRQNPEQRGILTASLMVDLIHFGDLEAARALEPEVPVAASYSVPAWLAYAAGDWVSAASIAVDVARDAMARGDNASAWQTQVILGRARIAQGDAAGARAAIEEGIDFRDEGESAQRKSLAGPILARIYLDEGEVERALELLEVVRSTQESLETAGAIGSRLAEVEAEIALAQGDEDRGRELFTKSIAAYGPYPEPWSEAEFRFRRSLQLRRRGDRAGADEQVETVRQIYTRIGAGQPWIDRLERAAAS
jgi:tetratricopeptide (TPR) repeat protein